MIDDPRDHPGYCNCGTTHYADRRFAEYIAGGSVLDPARYTVNNEQNVDLVTQAYDRDAISRSEYREIVGKQYQHRFDTSENNYV